MIDRLFITNAALTTATGLRFHLRTTVVCDSGLVKTYFLKQKNRFLGLKKYFSVFSKTYKMPDTKSRPMSKESAM